MCFEDDDFIRKALDGDCKNIPYDELLSFIKRHDDALEFKKRGNKLIILLKDPPKKVHPFVATLKFERPHKGKHIPNFFVRKLITLLTRGGYLDE